MSPNLVTPQAIELVGNAADQISKSLAGIIAMSGDTPPAAVDWVQTGILGVVAVSVIWGFKTGFLALGRELERERELGRDKDKTIKERDDTIAQQRQTLDAVILSAGRLAPVLTETARQVAYEKDNQEDRIQQKLDELRDAIIHGST